jgi:hypothetical protein
MEKGGSCMNMLEDIMSFGDLPQAINSRLSIVTKDCKTQHDFCLCNLVVSNDESKNFCIALILTKNKIRKATIRMESIIIESYNLSDIVRIKEVISIPSLNSVTVKNTDVKSVELTFSNGDQIFITPPQIQVIQNTLTSNYVEHYNDFISKISHI